MRIKSCFKCGQQKPISGFHRHPQMKDGRLNKCKECARRDAVLCRQKNLESVREHDRRRGQLEHRKAANRVRYLKRISTKAGRKKEWEQHRQWIERNRQKRNVHIVVNNAVKRGLICPQPCYSCGTQETEAHHEDYSKPFEITWLCKPCHGRRHREINEARRTR